MTAQLLDGDSGGKSGLWYSTTVEGDCDDPSTPGCAWRLDDRSDRRVVLTLCWSHATVKCEVEV